MFDPFAPMPASERHVALAHPVPPDFARASRGRAPGTRMETRVVLEALLARTAKLALAPGCVWDPNPLFWACGLRTLRVTME